MSSGVPPPLCALSETTLPCLDTGRKSSPIGGTDVPSCRPYSRETPGSSRSTYVSNRRAIVAEGLRKAFGRVQALDGVDLAVEPGIVYGLLGPHGAGKTTAVRILTTLLQPDAGRAEVAGFDVVRQADDLRASIGLAGQ